MSIKLNKRQKIAAEMLGLGHRPSEVARALASSRETISRWQKQDTFKKVVQTAQTEFLETIVRDRHQLLNKSHQVLLDALANDGLPLQTKANLAIRFLSMAGSSTNIYSTAERTIESRIRLDDDSEQAFLEIMQTLDKLSELKTSASNLSDYDFRNKATEIITPCKTE